MKIKKEIRGKKSGNKEGWIYFKRNGKLFRFKPSEGSADKSKKIKIKEKATNAIKTKRKNIDKKGSKSEAKKQVENDIHKKNLEALAKEDEKRNEEYYKVLRENNIDPIIKVKSDEIFKNLNEKQQASLENYKGNDYRNINSILREGCENNNLYKNKYNENDRKEFDNEIKNIDSVIEKHGETNYAKTYYRGTTIEEVENINIGDTFQSGQYLSTTLDKATANGFATKEGDVIIVFNNSKSNIKGFFMDFDSDIPEYEVLLPRNSKFICKDIREEETIFGNMLIYEMEKK